MKISDLILALERMKDNRGDLRVGFMGHYGEFYELQREDVHPCQVDMDDQLRVIEKEMIVEIYLPNIGEEPE